jgi:hypothetical protein
MRVRILARMKEFPDPSPIKFRRTICPARQSVALQHVEIVRSWKVIVPTLSRPDGPRARRGAVVRIVVLTGDCGRDVRIETDHLTKRHCHGEVHWRFIATRLPDGADDEYNDEDGEGVSRDN